MMMRVATSRDVASSETDEVSQTRKFKGFEDSLKASETLWWFHEEFPLTVNTFVAINHFTHIIADMFTCSSPLLCMAAEQLMTMTLVLSKNLQISYIQWWFFWKKPADQLWRGIRTTIMSRTLMARRQRFGFGVPVHGECG